METAFVEVDDESQETFKLSGDYMDQGDHIKALEIIENWITAHEKKNVPELLSFRQGEILEEEAKRRDNRDVKFAFLLGSVECFSENEGSSSFCAASLFGLGDLLGSSLYYRKSIGKAKEYLAIMASFDPLNPEAEENRRQVERMLKAAESRIASASPMEKCQPEVREPKKSPEPRENEVKELRSFWTGLNAEVKRKFMEVSIADFTSYVKRLYGTEGRDALEKVLSSAKNNKKWRVLMCRSCSKEFLYHKKFKNHLEQEHVAKFKPSTTKQMAQRVDEVWVGMIKVAGWEPVDTVAAAEMIKTRLEVMYENGWSRDWPLAADEERSKLLKEIRLLLVLLWERKILSCGLRDWMMHFVIKHLAQFELSEHTLTTECRLLETPQSICFLESPELSQILGLLKLIKCERNDGTELIFRAVESFYKSTQVKEKIDFDKQFSSLLLDNRLLRCEIAQFDDEGTVSFLNPSDHYAKAHAYGDDIISWLADHSSGDERFRFPRPVRAHNLDMWVAVLRAVQFTCRTLGTKYAKKLEMLGYDAALMDEKNLCIREGERRRNVSKDQWNNYASLLGDKCEEHSVTDARDSLYPHLFLCSVRDVLEEALHPTFDIPDLEDCLKRIHGHKNLSDDIVLTSIDRLRSVVANKVPLIDSKMLLVENSRTNLLNALIRLSVFDYRSYILRPLKEFLLEVLNAAAAEADLILEEEKKPQSKKKKHKSKKKTSTSMSSPLDENVEHEHSVNFELQGASPSLQTTGTDSMEPDNSLSSERARLEFPSNTVNEEEAQGMQNMPGETVLREGAARCNSALDMTLKRASTSMSSPLDSTVEHEHSVNLELQGTSPSLQTTEIYPMEPDNRLSSERARLEIPTNTVNEEEAAQGMQNMPGEESVLTEGTARCNSALDMTLKALLNIKVLKDDLVQNGIPFHDDLEEQVADRLYNYLLSELLESVEVLSMSTDPAEVLVSILEFWQRLNILEGESLVTRLFTVEEYEIMSCRKCRRKPNYPEQSSYGLVMAVESIRDLKCDFGNIKFEDILRMIRMEYEILCDIKTGGCGKTNFVHYMISRCPPIFIIMLEWEKNETEEEILETTKALDWEIDISRLYQGLEPKTQYRLVSMVGCGEEEHHICLAHKKDKWVSLRHDALVEEDVGNWNSVVRFCGERKVRPEILFYEAAQSWP